MPASTALQGFKASLQSTAALLDLERNNFQDPPPTAEQPAVEGLRGGAAVLMVASFELFLRSDMGERLAPLVSGPARKPLSAMSERIRISSTFNSLEIAIKAPPRERKDRLLRLANICRTISSDSICPTAFAEFRGSPDSERLKEVFGDLGVTDLFQKIRPRFDSQWGKPESTNFLSEKLDEIVNRRHVVAHTASALNITRGALAESMRFLDVIAEALDAELEIQVNSI